MLERRTPLKRTRRIERKARLETRTPIKRVTRRRRVSYPVVSQEEGCWPSKLPGAGPCDGRLVRCHLIDQQLLRKEFPNGFQGRPLLTLLADPDIWVWGCGGISGVGGHHGQIDGHKLQIRRDQLPPNVERAAAMLALDWWLDRRYGLLAEAA